MSEGGGGRRTVAPEQRDWLLLVMYGGGRTAQAEWSAASFTPYTKYIYTVYTHMIRRGGGEALAGYLPSLANISYLENNFC